MRERSMICWLAFAAVLAITSWAAEVRAYEAAPVTNGGSISGAVKFKGAPPARTSIDVNKDKEVCAAQPKMSQELIVGSDGGIQYAVVSLTNVAKGKPFESTKAQLDQNGCEYRPHVVMMPAGRELEILNSDGILHNIHTYSQENPPLNRAQPKFRKSISQKFDKPEVVKLSCDVHGWMNGWLVVQDHPYYAVTGEAGTFRLIDVPPGDYELKVWQEALGATTQKVSVKPGQDTKVTFELSAR